MPSRAMFLTGRTLFHLQGSGEAIPPEHVTLPECFRGAGYETFGVGKWHNGREGFARSFSGGNEIFFGGMADHWNVPCYRFDPTGQYAGRLPMVEDFRHSNKVTERECDHVTAGVHSVNLFCDAATRFLRGREGGEQPFFLYVAFLSPHDPRTMPEKFRSMYEAEKMELPENFQREHVIDTGDVRGRDESLAGFPRDPAEVKRHIAEYYGMISHLDDAIGRIRVCLEEMGLAENTIVVQMADHGIALGQHGLMGKQNVYDHSVRVPLVMSGPELPRGERREGWVYLMDVYPTLCELAGVAAPPSVEGRSLCGVLRGTEKGREKLYLAFKDSIRGIKMGRHKLIEYFAGGKRATQVFDLEKDPLEMVNLAEDGELVVRLRNELAKMRDEWEDLASKKGRKFWGGMEFG
jgi:arylsulfatase A-like enzyme